MTRGKFIALEGGEGTGKSTQARLLVSALEDIGLTVDLTREPGGTAGAEAIRELLLHPPEGAQWGARAEALLFAAARSDHVEKRILPALDQGVWVVSDRFVDSSRAYQGAAGELGDETIVNLHAIGSDGLRPDITILIEADPTETERRLSKRDGNNSDAIGGRSVQYHEAVARAFHEQAEADAQGTVIVDGSGSVDDVHASVMEAIKRNFG